MKEHLAKIEAYGKAHWKELLALVLAAIPAGFLIFHKGAQQGALNAISYIPAAFGAGGDGGGTPPASGPTQGSGGPGGDPGTVLAQAVGLQTPTNQPWAKILGTSVNGSSPNTSPYLPKTSGSVKAGTNYAAIAAAAPQRGPNISSRNTSGAQQTFQNFLAFLVQYAPSPQVVAQHTAAMAPVGGPNISTRRNYAPTPAPPAPAVPPPPKKTGAQSF